MSVQRNPELETAYRKLGAVMIDALRPVPLVADDVAALGRLPGNVNQ